VFVVLLMIGVGELVGFRFHHGFLPEAAAVGVALLLGYAPSWMSVGRPSRRRDLRHLRDRYPLPTVDGMANGYECAGLGKNLGRPL
jgi:hypothetical protein